MNLKSIIILSSLSTIYYFSGSSLVLAEETNHSSDSLAIAGLLDLSLEELMEVKITTASKTAENINDAPGIVSVITAAEIQKFGANSLHEVLDRITGIYLPSNWMYPQNVISLRGDLVANMDTHTLLLLNGRPFREGMTGGINNSFYLSLPLVSIEKIEVIRGPGSVLYGTGAFTGVINVITKTQFDSDQPTMAQLSAATGSLGTRTMEGYVAHQQGEFKWVGSVRTFREQGWKHHAVDIEGVTDSENYSERNAGAYGYGEYKNWRLNLAWLKDQQESWGEMPAWSLHSPGTENTRIFADLGYSHEFSPNWRLEANLTYNSRQTYFSSVSDQTDESTKDTLLELTNYWQKDKFSWLFGGTVYRLSGHGFKIFSQDASQFDYVQPYHNMSYTLYSQADYQLTEQTKLIVGGQAVKPSDLKWSIVPRLGMIHRLSDSFSLKALYSQAYRAASQFERSVFVPSIVIGNPQLQPETVKTFDLQLFYKTQAAELALTYFNSHQQDLVTALPNPQMAVSSYINQAEMRFHGLELEGKLMPIDDLYLVSSLTYQTNNNGDGKKYYSVAPTWTAKLGLNYKFTPDLSLGLFDSYFSKRHDVNIRFEAPAQYFNPEAKAFHLMTMNVDLKLNRLLGWSNQSAVALNAYLYNVLDEDIYTPESVLGVINTFPSRQGRGGYIGIKYDY